MPGHRLNRDQLVQRTQEIVAAVIGTGPDNNGIGARIRTRGGIRLLSLIQQNFVKLADGQPGVDGTRWPDLSPKTKAYSRRFGPGEQAELKRQAGVNSRRQNRGVAGKGGLLTAAEQKKWNAIFATTKARLINRGVPAGEAAATAGKTAWSILKSEGARTKLDVFGRRKVQILRDTGVLFNSFTPGIESLALPSGARDQLFDISRGTISVGTQVPYAIYHHGRHGEGKRPLWPRRMPIDWQREVADSVREGIAIAIQDAV